jgi:two-component system response regulator CpxR
MSDSQQSGGFPKDSSRHVSKIKTRDNGRVTGSVLRPSASLLLIDDDRSLAALIGEYCAPAGFTITPAFTGEEGIRLIRQQYFPLVILDVMLPGIDGFKVLARLRRHSTVPVLMLTTRGAAMDCIQGLDLGADDYLSKPFQPEVLVARIKSILRRTGQKEQAGRLSLGDVTLDDLERSTTVGDMRVDLTGAEFHLLHLLVMHPGESLSREELIPRIFGREAGTFDRSIDNLVNNLRKKLGTHPDGAERIKSIRNVGYSYVIVNDEANTQ